MKLCWYGATIENATFSSIIWRSIRFFLFFRQTCARAWTYQTQWPRLTVHPAPNIESRRWRYSSFFSSLPYIISRPWNVLIHIRVIACRWIEFFVPFSGGGWNCERETLGRSSGIIGRRTDGCVSHRLLFDSIYEHKTMRISAIPVFSHEQIRFPSQQENKRRKKMKIFLSFSLNTTATREREEREVDTSRNWRWKPSRASIRFFFFSQCSYRSDHVRAMWRVPSSVRSSQKKRTIFIWFLPSRRFVFCYQQIL